MVLLFLFLVEEAEVVVFSSLVEEVEGEALHRRHLLEQPSQVL